ncbi:MAG: hypothetical protein ACFFEF_06620 [Candidatus Thorarchaeota archaeon]
MTVEEIKVDKSTLKRRITKLIKSNLSSIKMIAEQLETSDEIVLELVAELIEERVVKGSISPDGSRFFRSDLGTPDLSQEAIQEEPEPAKSSLLIPKLITLVGASLFVAGQVLIRMVAEEVPLHNSAGAMVFLGMFTFIGGLLSFSRFGKNKQ